MGSSKRKEHEALFGINPVAEALDAGRRKIYRISIKKGLEKNKKITSIEQLARRRKIPVEFLEGTAIGKIADTQGHQGITALVSPPAYSTLEKIVARSGKSEESNPPAIAVLDGVQDPRNLGAIIRSAEALGFSALIFPDRRAVTYTPVAAKSSAGAGERINLCRVGNIAQTLVKLKEEDFSCVALEEDADEVLSAMPQGKLAVVLGGEGTGVRPLVLKRCDYSYRIPLSGKVGSLNVAAAGAIAFHVATCCPRR